MSFHLNHSYQNMMCMKLGILYCTHGKGTCRICSIVYHHTNYSHSYRLSIQLFHYQHLVDNFHTLLDIERIDLFMGWQNKNDHHIYYIFLLNCYHTRSIQPDIQHIIFLWEYNQIRRNDSLLFHYCIHYILQGKPHISLHHL